MKVLIFVLSLSLTTGVFAKSIRTPGGKKSSKSVTSRGKKHGEFLMIGRGAKNSILLSNNIFYKPSHDHDAKHTKDWELKDPIRVLKTKDDKHFILLNQRTGETMKGTILKWS